MFQLQLFFLLHCDEWDRVVALPRHKFVTGATLLQLLPGGHPNVEDNNPILTDLTADHTPHLYSEKETAFTLESDKYWSKYLT